SCTPFKRSKTPSIPQKQPPASTATAIPLADGAGSTGGSGNAAVGLAAAAQLTEIMAASNKTLAALNTAIFWFRIVILSSNIPFSLQSFLAEGEGEKPQLALHFQMQPVHTGIL